MSDLAGRRFLKVDIHTRAGAPPVQLDEIFEESRMDSVHGRVVDPTGPGRKKRNFHG
jgi:hypothetical protein